MTCVGYDILTADQEFNDDAAELFSDYFFGNRTPASGTGIAAFYIYRKPKILQGEEFAELHWIYEGEQYVTRYGLYAFRMCIKYDIRPELIKPETIDYKEVLNTLINKKFKLKDYETFDNRLQPKM